MKEYEEIKQYWDNRAKEQGGTRQATTNDYYMREIEINCLKGKIKTLFGSRSELKIADIGCGDGLSTIEIAKSFPEINFSGFDYSENMICSAKERCKKDPLKNIEFRVFDITKDDLKEEYDLIYTDRCLINLPSWNLQRSAIIKIHNALVDDGYYIMIENFLEGHKNFNMLRQKFSLEEIQMRNHNLFLNEKDLLPILKKLFSEIHYINISSQYYIVSRILYSKICAINNVTPDYFDVHHELAVKLPFFGNFGPIGMYHLRKKMQNE